MLAEPYICIREIKSSLSGDSFKVDEIHSHPIYMMSHTYEDNSSFEDHWMSYADWEREKLRQLGSAAVGIGSVQGFFLFSQGAFYSSKNCTGFSGFDYRQASENERLNQRLKFVKFVLNQNGLVSRMMESGCQPDCEPVTRKDMNTMMRLINQNSHNIQKLDSRQEIEYEFKDEVLDTLELIEKAIGKEGDWTPSIKALREKFLYKR